jgi:hypothetical protein
MSILPIQTRFFGVSRPGKVSFITRDVVLEPTEQVLSATITGDNSCTIQTNAGYFILNDDFDMDDVQVGYLCRINGTFTGEGSITGYTSPEWFYVKTKNTETRRIGLATLVDQFGIDTVVGAVSGVTIRFYEIRPVQYPVTVISSGAFFVDATVNRSLGQVFPDGETISINATLTVPQPDGSKQEVSAPIATFDYGSNNDGQFVLSKSLGEICAYPVPGDVFITVARTDYYGATAPAAQNCRVTLEIYSESSPSLN